MNTASDSLNQTISASEQALSIFKAVYETAPSKELAEAIAGMEQTIAVQKQISASMQEGVSAFQVAMTRCCAIFVSLFGGFFLSSYLTNLLGQKMLGREDEKELNQQFVGYSMVVMFVLDIISGLFSISILRWILQFYTVFVVYEGARSLLKVDEKDLTRYSLCAAVIIMICPSLIASVFDKLSLILN